MTSTLSGFALTSAQSILANTTLQGHVLGTYMETADGRGYRYAKVGAVATVAGKVYQGPALDATNQTPSGGIAVAAAAIGATEIVTTTTLTLAANILSGGYLGVAITPGAGNIYLVKSNTAASAAVTTITLEDPLVIALTTTSRVILIRHPLDGIIIEPGTPTAKIAGVPNAIFSVGAFAWIQTRGACSVLFTGTGAAGKVVGSLTGGTSGSMAPAIAATNIGGEHMANGITTEHSFVFLTIG